MCMGLNKKIVEESGTSLGSLLTRPNHSGCLYPDCSMDNAGSSHLRAGVNYTGVKVYQETLKEKQGSRHTLVLILRKRISRQ